MKRIWIPVMAVLLGTLVAAAGEQPYLGVSVMRPSAVLRHHLKLEPGQGLVVASVQGKSPAAKAGIEADPWETWKETYPGVNFAAAFPNRPLFVILGALIGLTLGLGAGLTREAFDDTVRGTRGVRSVMEMPPITAIPVIKTASDRRRDRMKLATVTAMVLVAVGAVGTYVHFQINGLI